MRLVEIGGKLVVQFTMTWEAAYLAEFLLVDVPIFHLEQSICIITPLF